MAKLFCDKCKKIMKVKDNIGTCVCGYQKIISFNDSSVSEKIKKPEEIGKGYVKDKNELATFPHECKKCGYGKAEVIEMGVWYGDASGVIRYKCGKCGFTEQDKDSNT